MTRQAAEQLLGGSLDGMQKGQAGKTLQVNLKFIDSDAPARNVVAAYIGSDPKLKGEWVALGAHNDHVGIRAGGPVDHDSLHLYAQASYPIRERIALYNLENHICGGRQQTGCNAATPGAASTPRSAQPADRVDPRQSRQRAESERRHSRRLDQQRRRRRRLRLRDGARARRGVREEKPKPKRSMLFVWHTGEEKGLLGSRYFTDHPTVPRDSIVAQINIDMVGRGAATDLLRGKPELSAARRLAPALDGARRSHSRR